MVKSFHMKNHWETLEACLHFSVLESMPITIDDTRSIITGILKVFHSSMLVSLQLEIFHWLLFNLIPIPIILLPLEVLPFSNNTGLLEFENILRDPEK